jgi:hypothetical protein
MRLLVSTGDGETEMEASPKAIRSALNPEGYIDYGTSFSLESLDGMSLIAICVSEVHLLPNEEGEFLLSSIASIHSPSVMEEIS